MSRPIVVITLAFLSGVAGGHFWDVPLSVALAGLLCLALLVYAVHRWHPADADRWRVCALILTAFILGLARYEWEELTVRDRAEEAVRHANQRGALISGTVAGPVRSASPGVQFDIERVEVHAEGRSRSLAWRVQVRCGFTPAEPLKTGDRVRLSARLEPIYASDWPGQFSYADYLAARNIHAQARVWQPSQLGNIGVDDSLLMSLRRVIGNTRTRILAGYHATLAPEDATLLAAMMLGERAALSPATERLLIETGVFHITTVSGLHITAIAVLLIFSGRLIGLKRRQAALLAIPLLAGFQCMVGWNHAALRSTFIGVALMAGRWLRRDSDTLASLAASALILVIITPQSLNQIGFQLSYLFTLGIILGGRRIQGTPLLERLGRAHWPFRVVGLGFIISLFAFLFGAPALAYHFQTVTPVCVLVNPVACGLVNLIMAGGLLQSLLQLIAPQIGALAAPLNAVLLHLLSWTVDFFHAIPFGHFRVPQPGLVTTLAVYGLLFAAISDGRSLQFNFRGRTMGRRFVILGIAAAWAMLNLVVPGRGELRVDFLSVGQGDAALIRFPRGGTMLVDGGPPQINAATPWERTRFAQYFRREGISRLDALVTTHPQQDHIGAAIEILEHFPVGAVFDPGVRTDSAVSHRYDAAIGKSRAAHHVIRQGNCIEGFDGVILDVVSPPADETNRAFDAASEETNESSTVLLLRYGEIDLLFTGDIGARTEEEIALLGDHVDVEILKIPHHGSQYSSTEALLAATTPDVAIIPVGRNTYGHPSPGTLDRLKQYAPLIYRTDRDGTVRVTTDGRHYRVESMTRGEAYGGTTD